METILPPTYARGQKVFWNWDILWSCNYRCSYCFFDKQWHNSAGKNRFPGLPALVAAWDRIYKLYGNCHVHIAGGEPFLYPDFMELLEVLGARHTLEMSTNLSFDADELIRRVPPSQIRLEPAFHIEFARYEEFLKKILKLRNHGYHVGITMVAAPRYLRRYAELKEMFEEHKFGVNLVPLRGKHYGKVYPDAYTNEERTLLKMAILEPETQPVLVPAGAVQENPEPKKDNPSLRFYEWHVDKSCEDLPKTRLCNMGVNYGKIHPNGDVLRCCTTGVEDIVKIGNIFDENFKLLEGPTPCSIQKCGCWKSMIVGEESRWTPFWSDKMK